ncbi:MAG TPA: hypothetical protein VF517_01455 [Thermoleophilaceae bacterium]
MWRGAIVVLMVAWACAWPGAAAAEPVSFAHGTIEHRYTTAQPNAPTGFSFSGTYHAANDPSADPPYMRKMTFYSPAGLRYDTSVPDRCTATDVQLQVQGPAACPEGSRLGGGTARGKFMGSESKLDVDVFNNAGEQVMLIHSPLIATVSRGRIADDGSIEYASPTCYPALVTCPTDTALQLGSDIVTQPYTRDGRSYTTTPPRCPKSGYWESPVRFWWADGSDETVVTKQPCTRPAAKAKSKRRSRSRAR